MHASPDTERQSIVGTLTMWLLTQCKQYRTVILSTLIAGLAAHLFFLSQKLVTFDDSLFTYGHTVSSGRWGLGILKLLVPPCSMPWFHGMASLLLMSATMVTLVKIYNIQDNIGRVLLPAVVITSAVHTSIFLFMFTSTPYALAILLTTLSVYHVLRPGHRALAWACVCLILSLSIYQVYLLLAVALLLVALSLRLLDKRDISRADLLRWSQRLGLYLFVSLAAYLAIALVGIALKGGMGASNYAYAVSTDNPVALSEHFTGVFTRFADLFTQGKLGLINTPLSVVLHLVLMVTLLVVVLCRQWRQGSKWRMAVQALLLLVGLPATINFCWLLFAPEHWNTLTVYPFVAIYVLAAALLKLCDRHRWVYDLIALCLAGITINDIYYDNRTYLQVHQQNVNTFAFYSGLATQVKLLPELNAHSRLALIGHASQLVYDSDQGFGYNETRGAAKLINSYSRGHYIKKQIGFDIPILTASEPEYQRLANDQRVQAMPAYPFDGSIQVIDSVIVVKLGEP